MGKTAIENGVDIINDVRGLSRCGSIDIVKKYGVSVCISHMKGNPESMQSNPYYKNVLSEIYNYFFYKIKYLENLGIKKNRIIIDPGFGFGKTLQNNIDILNNLKILRKINCPILVGLSRKSIIGHILN